MKAQRRQARLHTQDARFERRILAGQEMFATFGLLGAFNAAAGRGRVIRRSHCLFGRRAVWRHLMRALLRQRGRKVGDEVIPIFNSDGNADERFGNAIFYAALRAKLKIDRLRDGQCQRAVIAQIG